MKLALASMLMCVLGATAFAEGNRESQAKAAAKAWLAEMKSQDGAQKASADKPLLCWAFTPADACNACTGNAQNPTDAKLIKSCVQNQIKIGRENGVGVGKLAELIKEFGRAERTAMRKAAKNTTIIEFGIVGDGEAATISVAVAADQSIRAMWVSASPFE